MPRDPSLGAKSCHLSANVISPCSHLPPFCLHCRNPPSPLYPQTLWKISLNATLSKNPIKYHQHTQINNSLQYPIGRKCSPLSESHTFFKCYSNQDPKKVHTLQLANTSLNSFYQRLIIIQFSSPSYLHPLLFMGQRPWAQVPWSCHSRRLADHTWVQVSLAPSPRPPCKPEWGLEAQLDLALIPARPSPQEQPLPPQGGPAPQRLSALLAGTQAHHLEAFIRAAWSAFLIPPLHLLPRLFL